MHKFKLNSITKQTSIKNNCPILFSESIQTLFLKKLNLKNFIDNFKYCKCLNKSRLNKEFLFEDGKYIDKAYFFKANKVFFSKKFAKAKQSNYNSYQYSPNLSADKQEEDLFIKPKINFDKKSDKSNLNALEKMDEKMVVQYYFDLKNIFMDYYKGPNFKFFYFAFHIATCYLAINNLIQLYWLYQVFLGGTMIGISYLNFEFYATAQEKKIMEKFVLIW